MAFPNLSAEMIRNGVTEKDLSQVTDRSIDTIRNWLRGKTDIPIGKALLIRNTFFPKNSIEYLYSNKPFISDEFTKED